MKLLREMTEEVSDHVRIMEAIAAVRADVLTENKRGGRVTPKGSGDFFNSNPKLVIGAAALAISAQQAYQKNKRGTFTLHAKDAYERRMITRIVDSMTRSKKFKIARTKFQGGGKTWIMKTV